MTDNQLVEAIIGDIDSSIEKAINNEEFTNNEVVALVTVKVILENEVGD